MHTHAYEVSFKKGIFLWKLFFDKVLYRPRKSIAKDNPIKIKSCEDKIRLLHYELNFNCCSQPTCSGAIVNFIRN